MSIATYMLASLANNTLQKISFEIDEELHQIINAINIYRSIADNNMQYVWFNEFCRVLDIKNKENFYQNVLGGSKNLVEMPLGYDSTSHAAFFILTMHHNFEIKIVDLTNIKVFDPIHCYKINDKLYMPHDILNDKTSGRDSIYSNISMDIFEKYNHMREEARFGKSNGFDEVIFKKYCDITRDECKDALAFIESQPDNTEFEYMGYKFTKCIPINDPAIIYSLLVASGSLYD